MNVFLRTPLFLLLIAATIPASAQETRLSVPVDAAVAQRPFPRIAATPEELQRLRAIYQGPASPEKAIVESRIRAADQALAGRLEFPPRGGQHNQWYQCEACQLALETIDATHHRCPRCGKVYSGEPFDDVLYGRIHLRNLSGALDAAWALVLTGKPEYAEFTRRVLVTYAQQYQDFPYHTASRDPQPEKSRAGGHLFEQTLNEASALAGSIAPAYDLLRSTEFLSPEDDQLIQAGLLRPMLENIGKYRAGKSNWQTWHNAGMLAGGGVLGDPEWIQRAISEPGNGMLSQLQVSVSPEGMWYENSWAYHFYTLRAMILIAEYGRRLGMDLYDHPRLRSMFTIGPEYAMPGGLFPRFGDDVNSRVSAASSSLEFAYHADPDDALAGFLSRQPTWDSVLLGRTTQPQQPPPILDSRVFPGAGHAILRRRNPPGLASAMTFGPYGGTHGHLDKLSFVFFGAGRELGVDPGRARSQAYRLPVHRNWYKATLSHNTVVVDGKSQAPAQGELLLFDHQPSYDVVIARCTEAYPGVGHTRLLLQTDAYLLIFDDLQSDAPRRYDWFYHNRGTTVDCETATEVAGAEPEFPGMEFVERGRQGISGNPIRATFQMEKLRVLLTLDGAPDTGVLVGDGVGGSTLERVPLVRATRRGTRVPFLATLEPVAPDALPRIESLTWTTQADGAILIRVTGHRLEDQIRLAPDWQSLELTRAAPGSGEGPAGDPAIDGSPTVTERIQATSPLETGSAEPPIR